MHQTRNEISPMWPVPRKGTKYVIIAKHAKTQAIPLLYIIRDILKITKTKRETRFLLLNGNVKINGKVRKTEKFPLRFGDTITLEKGKTYRLIIVNGKFSLKEIPFEKSEKKIVKIIGKRVLGKGKIQLNLDDGQNFIIKENFSVGDSAIINMKERKVEKILPLKENSEVEVISGSHSGERGKVKIIKNFERNRMVCVKLKEVEVNLPLKCIFVTE